MNIESGYEFSFTDCFFVSFATSVFLNCHVMIPALGIPSSEFSVTTSTIFPLRDHHLFSLSHRHCVSVSRTHHDKGDHGKEILT